MSEFPFFDIDAEIKKLEEAPANFANPANLESEISNFSNFSSPLVQKSNYDRFIEFLRQNVKEGFRIQYFGESNLYPVYPEKWSFHQRYEAQRHFLACVHEIAENREEILTIQDRYTH